MRPPPVYRLPYRADSAALFEAALARRSWPVLLDSGWPDCRLGRYDILSSDPVARLLTRGAETKVISGDRVWISRDDPLTLLGDLLGPFRPGAAGLPFSGGAIGYFGYDLTRRLASMPALSVDGEGLPEMAIGIYDWAVVVDHSARCTHLVGTGAERMLATLTEPVVEEYRSVPFRALAPIACNLPRPRYLAAFDRIQRYLRDGDCYQVNLARRFTVPVTGDPWSTFRALRTRSPATFGAYLDIGSCQVLCASPERFLSVRDGLVRTCPIKGTRARHRDPRIDRQRAQALQTSEKDRAENLMIVDLLRNDLGKVCAIGSVTVPELFAIARYAQVHHLVSTIEGRLAEGRTAIDLLRACFPGGSITGAPKRRAMEIIEELEPHRRGVYCGSIGYIGFDGAMDTNIAIRTLVHSAGTARFWAGGGIVADSEAEAEYQETLDKAAALLGLLG